MKYQGHVLRHEIKYYINEGVYHILRDRFLQVLKPDENMVNKEGYIISSLYFDDVFNSALEEKISGTRFRDKYRIRIYDHSDKIIKLECKSKFDSFIAKKSASLSRSEYDQIIQGEYDFLLHKENRLCEKLYALHSCKLLQPVTVVEYQREAYVAEQGNVRLTFDKNISASMISLDMFSDDYVVKDILPPGMMVLEVKYDDFIPKYILNLIQSAMTQKCAISKYVMCRKVFRRIKQL